MPTSRILIFPDVGNLISFGSEGTDDADWSTESIADGGGRQSAQFDLGRASAGARVNRFLWRFFCQLQATTPVVGQAINVYLKTSDESNAHPDESEAGTGDAAFDDENDLVNLHFLGSAIVTVASANIEFVASGIVEIDQRHVQAVLSNQSGASITADVAETKLQLVPCPYEAQ